MEVSLFWSQDLWGNYFEWEMEPCIIDLIHPNWSRDLTLTHFLSYVITAFLKIMHLQTSCWIKNLHHFSSIVILLWLSVSSRRNTFLPIFVRLTASSTDHFCAKSFFQDAEKRSVCNWCYICIWVTPVWWILWCTFDQKITMFTSGSGWYRECAAQRVCGTDSVWYRKGVAPRVCGTDMFTPWSVWHMFTPWSVWHRDYQSVCHRD